VIHTGNGSYPSPQVREGVRRRGPVCVDAPASADGMPGGAVAPLAVLSHLLGGVRRFGCVCGAAGKVWLRDTARVPTIDDQQELRRRVVAAPVARLATVRRDGSPRLVPITFALLGELLCFAVDEVKPKRDARLARLDDIARDPRVTLLVDHYDADWSALWWVRIDGTAAVHGTPHTDGTLHTDGTPHTDGALRERALDELAAKYPPYRAARPAGPVVIVTPRRWSGWSAR
jgi:PPOX class probable F420-dependent enzyme